MTIEKIKKLMETGVGVLSDRDILEELNVNIEINPFDLLNLQPSSYDLRLGNEFYILDNTTIENVDVLDVKNSDSLKRVWKKIEIKNEDEGFIIRPKQFVLATSVEEIYISENISAFISGRSSIGRLGLFIENAGWVDSGFRGQITLELFNANNIPIKLYPNMRIAQIIFMYNNTPSENPYSGKYQNQKGTTISRIFQDIEFLK